jgi:hypothetical protein
MIKDDDDDMIDIQIQRSDVRDEEGYIIPHWSKNTYLMDFPENGFVMFQDEKNNDCLTFEFPDNRNVSLEEYLKQFSIEAKRAYTNFVAFKKKEEQT